MATARSIASLTLSFGLVNIPVRLYSATESGSDVRFNMLAKDGSRLKQQYVSEKTQKVVARAEMIKGYEVEKDHFVLFSQDELKALEEASSHVVDIVAFIPEKSVDPLYYDKAYLLAPDKRGGKPYQLLMAAMRKSGRCALAKWAWKAKQYVVQIRPSEDGLVLQQLRYADEVRMPSALGIERADVSPSELQLALQLIDQIAEDSYDPTQFEDEEKQRVLAAIDKKIAGKQIVASAHPEDAVAGGQVVDLMAALQASLGKRKPSGKDAGASTSKVTALSDAKERKAVKRPVKAAAPVAAPPAASPSRARK
ncbi:Ku protein [Pseudorhodoferax sp. LjRoot39]|uniref:non-homologous end joining protein Ku n=1 Tax=Pseudorhodoferax sp. LjRoot39 TaxID=3342328 RepID=UPI003ECF5779